MNNLIGNRPAIEPVRTFGSFDLMEGRSRILGHFQALVISRLNPLSQASGAELFQR